MQAVTVRLSLLCSANRKRAFAQRLGIFGGSTIFDFNWLRRAGAQEAVSIPASIFVERFNVFLLFLQLLGSERD
jgi:hypothetical protein